VKPVSVAEYLLPFHKIWPVVGPDPKLQVQNPDCGALVPFNSAILPVNLIKAVPVVSFEADTKQYYCYGVFSAHVRFNLRSDENLLSWFYIKQWL
jgi:hypothetical protein